MAQPTGSFACGELNFPLMDGNGDAEFTSSAPCYMYMLFRLPLMPPWLCDTTSQDANFTNVSNCLPQRLTVEQEIYIETADQEIYTKGFTAKPSAASWSHTHTGATGPDWETGDEDASYQLECIPFTNYPGTNNLPLIGVAEIKIWGDSETAYDDVYLYAMNIKSVNDNSETEEIEWISRNANKIYTADEAADSFEIADVLIAGFLLALEENQINFCIPMGRSQTTPAE